MRTLEAARRACAFAGALLGGAAGFEIKRQLQKGRLIPEKVINDLRLAPNKPKHVVKVFDLAKTPTLMASYVVFFPKFLKAKGIKALEEIDDAIDRRYEANEVKNPHRLTALPAVASAHLLATADPRERPRLSTRIAKTLTSPNREVREIVLQSLIGAASPERQTMDHFFLDGPVLRAIDGLIEEASDSEALISPLCYATELLLNTGVLRSADATTIRQVQKRLTRIHQHARSVPHFWYPSKLITIHQRYFAPGKQDKSYLIPPQRIEALIGCQRPWLNRNYIKHLTLIHARLAFSIWKVAAGIQTAPDGVMSPLQAKAAQPKALGLFKHFRLIDFLPGSGEVDTLDLPTQERSFQNFLRGEFRQLIQTNLRAVRPNDEEIRLREVVPFSQYNDTPILERLVWDRTSSRRGFLKRLLSEDGAAMLSGAGIGYKIGEELGEWLYPSATHVLAPSLPRDRSSSHLRSLVDHAVEEAIKADVEQAEELERLQSTFGDVRLQERRGLRFK